MSLSAQRMFFTLQQQNIPSFYVFSIVFHSLKYTQLFAFMFVNYCIIYSGKTCCFIHLQILNVNSLIFYILHNVSGIVKWLCPNLSLFLLH